MNSIIETLLDAARYAPSGDNIQPWEFAVRNDVIELYNVPEKDLSLYNFKQRAAYVAHGAAIENMEIAASHAGYRLDIKVFPDADNPNLIARIKIGAKTNPQKELGGLAAAITKRATNRKKYKNNPLTDDEEQTFLDAIEKASGAQVILIKEKDKKKQLARLLSTNERLVFENRYLHDFLFGHIRWTNKEAEDTKTGLILKTLELTPPQEIAFKIFRQWTILNILNKFGISRMVARENAGTYASSAALGAITLPNANPESYLNAGRVFERIWLSATTLGMSIQPLTGVAFLGERIRAGNTEHLSSKQVDILMRAYDEIRTQLSTPKDKTLAFLFRVGFGGQPSAYSPRLPREKLIQ